MKQLIFCIIGKSGTGKNTLLKIILENNNLLKYMVPFTTRPMRENEINGKDYIFLSNSDIFKFNNVLEHRIYNVSDDCNNKWIYGNYKPTEKYNIMIGTIESCKKINATHDYILYPIYIKLPDDERLYRIINRSYNDTYKNAKELVRRFYQDNVDFNDETLTSIGIDKTNTFINFDKYKTATYINNYINEVINHETM